MTPPAAPLTREGLLRGLRLLARRDPDLARLAERLGPPPLWARRPGFPTLVRIVLEQQVSLASARAAFERLRAEVAPLTPRAFLDLDAATLRAIGFSRQKAAYCRALATAIVERRLRLSTLPRLDDERAREELMRWKGIGRWTADIYLLMALRRPDVWPSGDLALLLALQRAKGLVSRPGSEEAEEIAAAWRPWRAVAARLLWHDYLSRARARRRHRRR